MKEKGGDSRGDFGDGGEGKGEVLVVVDEVLLGC